MSYFHFTQTDVFYTDFYSYTALYCVRQIEYTWCVLSFQQENAQRKIQEERMERRRKEQEAMKSRMKESKFDINFIEFNSYLHIIVS